MAVQATIEVTIRASAMAPGAAARIWLIQPNDAASAWCVVVSMRPNLWAAGSHGVREIPRSTWPAGGSREGLVSGKL